MKKIQDYQIGENVYEEDFHAGKVAAVAEHPDKPGTAYVLLVNTEGEYTIYRGQSNCNAGLSLTRNIPRAVATYFAEVILGKEQPVKEVVRKAKKFPVISREKEPEQVREVVVEPGTTKAPYFDFV